MSDLSPEIVAQLLEPFEDQHGGNIVQHVRVSEQFTQRVNRFNIEGNAYNVEFVNLDDVDDLQQFLLQVIAHLNLQLWTFIMRYKILGAGLCTRPIV